MNVFPAVPGRDLQNYMVWRFVMNVVVDLSAAYRDTKKAFRKVRQQQHYHTTPP